MVGQVRSTIAAAMMSPLLILGGCTGDIVMSDKGFDLVKSLSVVDIAPATSTESGLTEIILRCENGYAGRGTMFISGRAGGNDVGILHSPVQGAVGSQIATLDLPAGSFDIGIAIEITSELAHIALDVIVSCDSLMVNDALVPWQSPEAYELYRDDIPDDTADIFNLTSVTVWLDQPAP